MPVPLKPRRGGSQRSFGCAWFIREFLAGHGPAGSPAINPFIGAPQAEIFFHYKTALIKATAADRATKDEERLARKEKRCIDPDNIDLLAAKHLARIPYKTTACRYHSFVVYFSNLQRLGWVEATKKTEPSSFQDHYAKGQPRRYFRLTAEGMAASDSAWANPLMALYGSR